MDYLPEKRAYAELKGLVNRVQGLGFRIMRETVANSLFIHDSLGTKPGRPLSIWVPYCFGKATRCQKRYCFGPMDDI